MRRADPIVLPSTTTIETVADSAVCGPCTERDGKELRPGDPIEHPACENQNGCRCVALMKVFAPQPPAGTGREEG